MVEINRLGNIYGEDKGTGYAGNVWDNNGLCPTITTMQGGNREPMIVASRGKDKTAVAPNAKDLTLKRYGKLVALENTGKKKNQSYIWKCKCDCGNTTEVNVKMLQSGNVKSCGCLVAENHFSTHGMTNTRIHSIWKDMRQRCNNPNNHAYKHYGARGITICDEWEEFEPFYKWAKANGYEENLSIDRIDNNGNYEPSNCRWATQKEQMNNVSYNNLITHEGITKTLQEWSEITGVSSQTIAYRVNNGWNIKRALYEPAKLGKNQYTESIICASRGRNPDNSSDRKVGSPMEQRLEPNSEGICNCLTTISKDNMVLKPTILQSPRGFNKGGEHKISPNITSHSWECNNFLKETPYRIRKLTPLECWRLMGFTDEDFYKAQEVNSNSQLYKQAGNSIVVSVLEAIFRNFNIKGVERWD